MEAHPVYAAFFNNKINNKTEAYNTRHTLPIGIIKCVVNRAIM